MKLSQGLKIIQQYNVFMKVDVSIPSLIQIRVILILIGPGGAKGDWQNRTGGCHGSLEGDEKQHVNPVNPRFWNIFKKLLYSVYKPRR